MVLFTITDSPFDFLIALRAFSCPLGQQSESDEHSMWSYLIKQAVWRSISIPAFPQQLPTSSRTNDFAVDQMTADA